MKYISQQIQAIQNGMALKLFVFEMIFIFFISQNENGMKLFWKWKTEF